MLPGALVELLVRGDNCALAAENDGLVAPVDAGMARVDPAFGDSFDFGNSKLFVALGVNVWAWDAVVPPTAPGIARPGVDGGVGEVGIAPLGN